MPRYWVIAPVESKPTELFDRVWQFDLANNLISIGWKQLGDVSTMSREVLAEAVAADFPDKPLGVQTLWGNMIWAFYHEISPGDFIIARRGLKVLVAVGKVIRSAYYLPGKSPVHSHPNFLEVSWEQQPRDKAFSNLAFKRYTLAEITEGEYVDLAAGSGIKPPPDDADALEDPGAFALEKYLEDFIVSNFDTIFKGALKIFEDEEGYGQQYLTDIGPIDILATEPSTNSFVVIELKKGRPSDKVIGQILSYMGWVKKNLCSEGQAVKGLVICRDPDPRLSSALEMTNDIDVRYYSVSFKLREAP